MKTEREALECGGMSPHSTTSACEGGCHWKMDIPCDSTASGGAPVCDRLWIYEN
jgi:hypothetical protein